MAEVWKEVYKIKRKGLFPPPLPNNYMWGLPMPPDLPQTLAPKEVWFVRVCSFTFTFHSVDQIKVCLAYYEQKIHASSLIPANELGNYGGDSSECQRWFDRLPMYLLEEPKRKKVVAALRLAVCASTKDETR
jgi:hypothetical protein